MISPTAEYALRAVVFLAGHAADASTNQAISKATKVPGPYLSKILQALGRADLVRSQRGVGGGYVLSKPLEEISVFSVITAVEPFRRIRRCPLGLPAHVKLCPLHSKLDQGLELVERLFAETSVADLVNSKSTAATCRFPRVGAGDS